MASVELEGVHKRYAGAAVVRDLSLRVEAGARCVLLGPSGCGKTTTLRMVAGLEPVDGGRIRLGEALVADLEGRVHVPPERRGLGMVFQTYALWPHLNVAENVAYPLRRQGAADGQVRKSVAAALAQVHLSGLEMRAPHALSGGQQQRVALARALVARPRVLLTDEPLSNLDARLRDELRAEIANLCQTHGITLVHVTHDQAEALSLATLVAVMNAGCVAQVGPPHEVYAQPQSLFVASFLGDTSVVRGTLASPESVQLGDHAFVMRVMGQPVVGAAMSVALRPEDLALSDGRGLPGRVRVAGCVGPSWMLEVETDVGTVRLRAPTAPAPGQGVHLTVTGGHAFAAVSSTPRDGVPQPTA